MIRLPLPDADTCSAAAAAELFTVEVLTLAGLRRDLGCFVTRDGRTLYPRSYRKTHLKAVL